jgi:putative ABC transport system substrate-binding protein
MAVGPIKRRTFIAALGSAAACSVATHAQPPTPVVGFLSSRSPDDSTHLVTAFRGGLEETGFIEGRNVAIEYRWAEGNYDRLPALAADLVARQVAAIVATAIAPAQAAKSATAKIPIIFQTGADPIQFGLVDSLSRPKGNLTGVAIMTNTFVPKQLELLHDVAPTAMLVAWLVNPKNPIAETDTQNVKSAARSLGQQVIVLDVSNDSELDVAFAALAQQRAGSVLVQSDPFLNSRPDKIAALAARYVVPVLHQWIELPAAGGLMSYGTSNTDAHRQLGIYAGKILKGAKPADLPVQQAVKVQLVINLKTAKSLGITVPLLLLGRADEVIE